MDRLRDLHSFSGYAGSARPRQTHSTLRVDGDERLARVELRRQIGRLEAQLGSLFADAFPRVEIDAGSRRLSRSEPRALGLGDLEAIRDSLATRIGAARRQLQDRAELETRNRELLEQMLTAPAEHKWLRISRADVGEPGCGHWHSRPRLGPLGMLMGWWRVKVSSGCPLSGRLAAVERETQGQQESPTGRRPSAGAVGIVPPRRADACSPASSPWWPGSSSKSPTTIGIGVVLAALGGLEVSAREHFAGYRSHTTLLAGTVFVLVTGVLFYLAGLILAICLAAGASPSPLPSTSYAAPSKRLRAASPSRPAD